MEPLHRGDELASRRAVAVLVVGALLVLWSSKRHGGSLGVNSATGMVARLFLGGLGASFLVVAADLPAGADGISDFKGVGMTFLVMSVLGLGFAFVAVRYGPRVGVVNPPIPATRDWLAWLGALAAGAVIGIVVGTLIVRASS